MTPAEWLAVAVLGSVLYGAVETIVDPDAVVVQSNNNLAAFLRILIAVVTVILAVVVLL